MKLAFSTLPRPDWDAPIFAANAAAKAKELGYEGVELHAVPGEAARVRDAFAAHGVAIACLACEVAVGGSRRANAKAAADARRHVDLAAALNCALVKICETSPRPHGDPGAAAAAFGRWLRPLGDLAIERGVTLVVSNSGSFPRARLLWEVLESAAHPAIAAAWDLPTAARAGERPAVSVPTLNSRIQYARVSDAELGDGDAQAEQFLARLQGIGYGGFVTVSSRTDEQLRDALATLRRWTAPRAASRGRGAAPTKQVVVPPAPLAAG